MWLSTFDAEYFDQLIENLYTISSHDLEQQFFIATGYHSYLSYPLTTALTI